MDKRQENQMTMFYATQRTLTLNESVWTAKPAVADAAQELDTNIGAVEGCIERQVIDIRGFARVKEECETAMLNQTILVAGGVRAYATVIGDSVLLGKMDVSRGSLLRHRDSVIAQHCQGIHTAANEVVANLADYSILPATLTALQTAIDKYVAAIVAPQNAIALRKGATAELRTLMRDTNKLLTKRLDALMEQFAFSNSEFYRDYQNARIVIDLGTGSGDAPQTPVPVAA
ncbi:MAG: hypothetical protein IPI41_05440 [Flavobacteriales bacterium]|nr:hypothetical protein [Flavobacteriales bacterium]